MSSNGVDWSGTALSGTIPEGYWNSVVWSSSYGYIAHAGNYYPGYLNIPPSGTPNGMMKSTDGLSWSTSNMTWHGNSNAIGAAISPTGVIVAPTKYSNGVINISTNGGSTWSTNYSVYIDAAGVAYGNGTFVISGSGGGPFFAYSNNGTSWSSTSIIESMSSEHKVKFLPGAGVFVSIAPYSQNMFISQSGDFWELVTLPYSDGWTDIDYLNGTYMIIAGGGGAGSTTQTTDPSGPGGAGGVIAVSNETLSPGTSWPIVIGGGGTTGAFGFNGTNGTNTTVNGTSIIALGGGGGGRSSNTTTSRAGSDGGSGGGASSSTGTSTALGGTGSAGSTSGLSGTVLLLANNGGRSFSSTTSTFRSSGGAGGAGGAGTNASLLITTPQPGGGGNGNAGYSSWLSAASSAIPQWQVINATASGTSGSSTITTDTTNLFTGMSVSGTGVAAGAVITVVGSTTITVSPANTGAVSGPLTFTLSSIAAGGQGISFGGTGGGGGRGGVKRTTFSSLVNSGAGVPGSRSLSAANAGSGVVIVRYLRTAV